MAKKFYVAGPMTGIPEFNFPAFHSAAAALREVGFHVVNPAEIVTDTTTSWEDCMRRDLVAMMTCDAVAVLPNWFKSRGARLEVHIAASLGMQVIPVEQAVLEMAEQVVTLARPTA